MKKIFSWVYENILFIETIVLLAFIPLFPKLPLLDIKNTWVYIRAEDFVVLFVLLSWLALLFKKKITLNTPLTFPILIFWLVGAVATLHGILIIFPNIANVFSNVAFLSLLRHIEYMSLFFIAYQGIKDRRLIPPFITVLVGTLFAVIFYGFGQKYLGFPAYLTMNEEFAKGIPIHLSSLSRVPSTFAGHYDLAAYLVLIIPIVVSLIFGVKNWIIKIILAFSALLGFILLFMTVSRVSFFVLFAALFVVLFFQKKKLFLASVPVIVILGTALLILQPTLLTRFQSTVSEVDVLVDAKTGVSLGHVNFVEKEYFRDKIVFQTIARDKDQIPIAISNLDRNDSSSSAIVPFRRIPNNVPLVKAVNVSNGESLPQGTGYINLSLSPVTHDLNSFYFELPGQYGGQPPQIVVIYGDYIVKRAAAYDLSFTTRFQGEWPRAIEAFKRNILFGSGYGSVSLAVDNNYLRILGEVGLLGFVSLLGVFLSLGIYIKKFYSDIDSKLEKSFVLGFSAGVIGLGFNAFLIDVFEASKIAFLLWMLSGVTLSILVLNQKKELNLITEIRKVATSSYAVIIYLFIFSVILFSPMLNNYFVGDDFTWLRWAGNCSLDPNCNAVSALTKYFTDSDGFFYRPGTKIYFYLMYQTFWLNQVVYHLVSLLLHFALAALFFLLAKKILRNNLLSILAAFLFLFMSGPLEAVFWISTTGTLVTSVFGLLGLLLYISWDEKRKGYYLLGSILSFSLALLFQELGIIFPLLVTAYEIYKGSVWKLKNLITRIDFLVLFTPAIVYLLVRLLAKSHWFNGDYGYDLFMLPFNFVGNLLGYASLVIIGPMSMSFYEQLRMLLRENIFLAVLVAPAVGILAYFVYRFVFNKLLPEEKKVIVFGLIFFIISLLPFLGLGNITSRYSYFASMGLILITAVAIKKAYEYFRNSGREIALGFISVSVLVFSLFHIIQLQQTYSDWHGAGTRSNNFFISIDSLYKNSWSEPNMEFHFIDVPIRVGQAWLFPVGLKDALWFAFRNDNAKVFIDKDLETALQQTIPSTYSGVFKFNEDGSVTEVGVKGVRKGFDIDK